MEKRAGEASATGDLDCESTQAHAELATSHFNAMRQLQMKELRIIEMDAQERRREEEARARMALGALEKRTFLALHALEQRAAVQEQQAGALGAQGSSCHQESNGAGCAAAPPAEAPSENGGLLGADLDASFGASDGRAPVAAPEAAPVATPVAAVLHREASPQPPEATPQQPPPAAQLPPLPAGAAALLPQPKGAQSSLAPPPVGAQPPLTQKPTPVAASASGGGTTTDSATDACDSMRDVDTGMDGAGGGDSPRDSYVWGVLEAQVLTRADNHGVLTLHTDAAVQDLCTTLDATVGAAAVGLMLGGRCVDPSSTNLPRVAFPQYLGSQQFMCALHLGLMFSSSCLKK
jgi:hypothetical protein